MNIIEFSFALYLIAISLTIIYRTRQYQLYAHRQRVIDMASHQSLPTVGFVGYSILCCEASSISDVERLLNCEYSRYEVILSLNFSRQEQLLTDLLKRYKMVKVSHPTHTETGVHPIKNLYRSRQRGYRRLVVIDCASDSTFDSLNAALSIASYNYIIPTFGGHTLRCNALLHLATILSTKENQGIELIRCHGLCEVNLFQRDMLAERGGFSLSTIQHTPHNATLHTLVSPFCPQFQRAECRFALLLCVAFIIATATIISLLISWEAMLCAIGTLCVATTAALYTLKLQEIKNCSVKALLYQIRNLTRFFHPRKFTIS